MLQQAVLPASKAGFPPLACRGISRGGCMPPPLPSRARTQVPALASSSMLRR